MLFTHRFGSVESLSRARFWLNWHGIPTTGSESNPNPESSRLTMNLDFSQASSAFALIDSIEKTDPQAWPGLLTQAKEVHAPSQPGHPTGDASLPAHTPIHWHSREESSPIDPTSRKVAEYMLSRWE